MGTRSQGVLHAVTAKDGQYVSYRGRNKKKQMMKKLEEPIPHYENPYRVPRSKRELQVQK